MEVAGAGEEEVVGNLLRLPGWVRRRRRRGAAGFHVVVVGGIGVLVELKVGVDFEVERLGAGFAELGHFVWRLGGFLWKK